MSEFKELELEINDLGDELVEERVRAILAKINGIHTARITQTGVHIIYNPLGITPDEIIRMMLQSGFKIDYQQPGIHELKTNQETRKPGKDAEPK